MNFDCIIANPPYQSGNRSIYNEFIDLAIKLNPNNIVMIAKNNWITGKTHEYTRNNMIKYGLKYIKNYTGLKDVFSDCSVAVAIFQLVKDFKGDAKYIESNSGKLIISQSITPVFGEDLIVDRLRQSIINKVVQSWDFIQFDRARNARMFSIASNGMYMQSNYTEDIFDYSDEPTDYHNVAVVFLDSSKKIYYKYLNINTLPKGIEQVYKYKVVCGSKVSSHNDVITNIHILYPGEIPTNSFGIIGVVDTEEEAKLLYKYAQTELFRVLTSFAISGDRVTYGIGCCKYIPDIKVLSDLDWSDSVDIIDNQLYAKYCIGGDEIQYIRGILNN